MAGEINPVRKTAVSKAALILMLFIIQCEHVKQAN